ncbi:hypothetical protein Ciccas_011571, partial [Cichlidogyrus casuarinus]
MYPKRKKAPLSRPLPRDVPSASRDEFHFIDRLPDYALDPLTDLPRTSEKPLWPRDHRNQSAQQPAQRENPWYSFDDP